MQLIYKSKVLLCAGALLVLGSAVAFGQDTTQTRRPTSTKRIPISKEGTSAGVVSRRGRVDTVTVYKTDTLRVEAAPAMAVHDTVRVTNTVTRVDTVTVTPPPRPVRLPNGFYFGLAGGVSAPNGALFTPNSAGPSAQAQLGWQGAKQLLGVRGDVNWTKPGEDSRFSGLQADPDIINFSADVKLQLPFLTHTFGTTHRFGIYGIGGYTYTMFKNLPMRIDSPPGTAVFSRGSGSWDHQNGWNAGGGLSLGWGRTELFIESRVLAFDPSNAPQSRQIPFMFGMNWY
ncbi:MAG TPA: hypothetical protein VF785_16180 [Gemmatimonadaceae bacterium]